MNKIALAIAVLILAGCSKPPSEWEVQNPLDLQTVPGLQDCSYHKVFTGSIHLNIIRCPNSSVSTTTSGKNPINTTTVSE